MRQRDVSPVDFMLGIVANEALDLPMRLDAARSVAPYTNPRLAVIDATIKAKSEVTITLSPEELRQRAREAILQAFAERPPLTIAGEYKVLGGSAVRPNVASENSEPTDESSG